MNCYYHNDQPSVAQCTGCGKGLCFSCASRFSPTICKDCYNSEIRSKRSEILRNFFFSIPEDLSTNLFYRYNLLFIQAKDKCYKDITEDTVIFAVRDYYIHKKDNKNAALAAFYCARVLHEQKEEKSAQKAYLIAIELADKIQDYNLMGLAQGNLGILYREHFMFEEAIIVNKKAVEMYRKAKNYKNEISAISMIGGCFILEDKIDSAFWYFDEGIKLADQFKLPDLQSSVRQSKGVAYREKEDFESAERLLNEALIFASDSLEQVRILMNLSKVFLLTNRFDSAKYYLNRALAISFSDLVLRRYAYHLLSVIEEENENYLHSLNYFKDYYEYTIKVFDSEENNKVRELQQKYDFEKLKNSKNALIIKQHQVLFTLSVVLLVTCIIILFFYYRFIQSKKLLLESEDTIIRLQKMAKELSEEKQSLRSIILQYFDVLRKVASIEKYITNSELNSGQVFIKKINKIVYGQDRVNWEKLFHIMNEFQNGFYNKIHEKYPQLKEIEFQICCLSCETGFDDMDIAIIIGKSVDMVRRIRSDIRKKLGMKVYAQDFYSFLLHEMNGN